MNNVIDFFNFNAERFLYSDPNVDGHAVKSLLEEFAKGFIDFEKYSEAMQIYAISQKSSELSKWYFSLDAAITDDVFLSILEQTFNKVRRIK